MIYEGIVIPTYVVNLKEKAESLRHILEQFIGRPEFDVHINENYKQKIDSAGLWINIVKIVKLAMDSNEDIVIICDDNHEFTEHYSKEYLFENIISANEQGVAILFGGIGGFGHAVPLTLNRMWINPFTSALFIVLYKKIFNQIINFNFKKNNVAESVLSEITSHKMVLFPFISQPRNILRSDSINMSNEVSCLAQNMFTETYARLELIQSVYIKNRLGTG